MKIVAALGAGLLGTAVGAAGAVRLATRLDWLHARTDAAWAALDAALDRRALSVSRLGAGPTEPGRVENGRAEPGRVENGRAEPGRVENGHAGTGRAGAGGAALAVATHAAAVALQAGPALREEAENELGQVIAVLDRTEIDPDQAAQLADAEARVVIARRVYNDAVRDTLALRSHRMVRWLRLAGTAPVPRYFEIAEPPLPE